MTCLGVITGTRVEARHFAKSYKKTGPLADIRLGCAGGSIERAYALAVSFVRDGATGLMSYGLAGGLAPNLSSGDLILPTAVIRIDGPPISTTPDWHERLRRQTREIGSSEGLVITTTEPVQTPTAKTALFERSGALSVDMESYGIGQAALENGVGFVVVRAISDDAQSALPDAAIAAMGPNGETRLWMSWRALFNKPSEIGAVLRLAVGARHALTTLDQAMRLSGRLFALG